MLLTVVEFVNLLCAGVLAGEEFATFYGVGACIVLLDNEPGIKLRQALIRRLRVLTPLLFGMAFLSGTAAVLLSANNAGEVFRCAGLVVLILFISIALGGTVPINKVVLAWNAASPPEGWRATIHKWEQLDIARTWSAILAFGLFLANAVLC